MSLANALLKGTIFDKKIAVEGVVQRCGVTVKAGVSAVHFTLVDDDRLFSANDSISGLVLMDKGDRVRFVWQPGARKLEQFSNLTYRGPSLPR